MGFPGCGRFPWWTPPVSLSPAPWRHRTRSGPAGGCCEPPRDCARPSPEHQPAGQAGRAPPHPGPGRLGRGRGPVRAWPTSHGASVERPWVRGCQTGRRAGVPRPRHSRLAADPAKPLPPAQAPGGSPWARGGHHGLCPHGAGGTGCACGRVLEARAAWGGAALLAVTLPAPRRAPGGGGGQLEPQAAEIRPTHCRVCSEHRAPACGPEWDVWDTSSWTGLTNLIQILILLKTLFLY